MLARVSSVARPIDGAARRFASQASKPSALSQLLWDAPSQNSLTEEFPGVPAPQGKAAAPAGVQVTKLSNGLTVASQDQRGATASIGIYIKAGSRFEAVPGTSHVLEQVAFKTTQKRSTAKLQRDVEDIGAVVSAKTSRETFVYAGEALRENGEALTETLAEALTQPKLWAWEVEEAKHELEPLAQAQLADPVTAIVEGIHAAAYGATTSLGHGVYADGEALGEVNADTLRSFLGASFTGANIVVAANNVKHDALLDAADKFLSVVPEGVAAKSAKALYTGGETLIRTGKSGVAHVAIALPAPGLDSKSVHALGVLQTLLGGTGAHGGAAGAVQLGYHRQSRIARSLHNEAHSFIRSLTAFAFPYTDAGLLGLAGSCADHEAGRLVNAAVGFLKDAAGGAAITPEELARAKKQYKLAYVLDVESRAGARDDLGTQLVLSGKFAGVAETLKAIDAVTAADVAGVAKAALGSAPSVAAIGSLNTVPRYDVLASMLK